MGPSPSEEESFGREEEVLREDYRCGSPVRRGHGPRKTEGMIHGRVGVVPWDSEKFRGVTRGSCLGPRVSSDVVPCLPLYTTPFLFVNRRTSYTGSRKVVDVSDPWGWTC